MILLRCENPRSLGSNDTNTIVLPFIYPIKGGEGGQEGGRGGGNGEEGFHKWNAWVEILFPSNAGSPS